MPPSKWKKKEEREEEEIPNSIFKRFYFIFLFCIFYPAESTSTIFLLESLT